MAFDYERFFEQMMMMMTMSLVVPGVTALIAGVTAVVGKTYPLILNWIYGACKTRPNCVKIQRSLNFSMKTGMWIPAPEETYNNYLMHGILEYLNANKIFASDARCSLGTGNFNTANGYEFMASKALELVSTAPVRCGDFTISFQMNDQTADDKKNNMTSKTESISIVSEKSVEEIRSFIDNCYREHILRVYEDKTTDIQYLYKQMPSKDGIRFKKYQMTNATSFDDLYFPEKQKIIELADKLKSGQLTKLSILLHGIPGCGKSSVIKALAKYLGYSVIEVKLSFIQSDAGLMDIFHNKSLMFYANNDEKFSLQTDHVPLNERIYIFEDIDAECSVIHQRKQVSSTGKHVNQQNALPSNVSSKEIIPSEKTKTINLSDTSDDKTDVGAKNIKVLNDEDEEMSFEKMLENTIKNYTKKGLTLSGILNIFDGVLEVVGCMIFTTNYPEKLDEAFKRPGRITIDIELKKMLAIHAREMIKKKFGDDTDLSVFNEDYVFTPALLESYCQTTANAKDLCELFIKNSQKV